MREIKVLGVDDFALRRGCEYGTCMVDLEKHELVDLLQGREAAPLAEWLRQHPDCRHDQSRPRYRLSGRGHYRRSTGRTDRRSVACPEEPDERF